MSASNLHSQWARLFVHALAASAVERVVVSPGSRSTPLVLAVAELADAGRLHCHCIADERSAAFFALGQARITGRPSMLLCTSGTAGAHYLPAIIEAHQSFIPLLVVTADRPWELYDVSASQTIDQTKMFGSFVRHFVDLGLADPAPAALRAVPRIAAQSVARTLWPVPGPVHVNARFRKPLEPVPHASPEPWQPDVDAWLHKGPPRIHPPHSAPPEPLLDALAERARRAERGMIVCGPLPADSRAAQVREAASGLARATGFPILAEATSQLRFGALSAGTIVCSAFDTLLRSAAFRARHAPDLILQIGTPPTSQGYALLLAEHPEAARFVITPHGYSDPAGTAEAMVFADPADVCRGITARLASEPCAGPSAYALALLRADEQVWRWIDASLPPGTLTEAHIVRAAVQACPADSVLVLGNSMPVRDADTYCPASAHPLRVIHQRGASGIDGLVSGTLGVHSVASDPITLILGDISLLHDISALHLARAAAGPLVIVVVQNGGGRIFDRLPVARGPGASHLERYFVMPQEIDLAHAAAAFGVAYARAETPAELAAVLQAAQAKREAVLVEAVVPPQDGAARASALWAQVDSMQTPDCVSAW